MQRVAIGSQNPSKVEAVQAAFKMVGINAEVVGVDVQSGVSAQPFSDEETIQGALNRAKHVINEASGHPFDYGVGLEGGVVDTPFGMFVCNWGAIIDRDGVVGIGGGHRIQLPESIVSELHKGRELGSIIDSWTGGQEIKKKEGTIGILTANHITRVTMFRDVVICALVRFLNPAYYDESPR